MTFSINGRAEVDALLAGIERRARFPRPFLAGTMTDAVHEFYREQFVTEGRAGGDPWQRLAPTTPEGLPGILRFRGQLWASLTRRNHPQARVVVGDRTLEVGTNDPRATKHQLGQDGLPRRKIVPDQMPVPIVERWAQLTADYVVDGVG